MNALDAQQAAGDETEACCSQDRPHRSTLNLVSGKTHWVTVQWSWAERPEFRLPDDDEAAGASEASATQQTQQPASDKTDAHEDVPAREGAAPRPEA